MIIKEAICNYLIWKNDYATNYELRDYIGNELNLKIRDIDLRDYINKLRNDSDLINNGKIIIASNKGYKLTQNKEEVGKYLKSRWGELTREMKTLKNMGYACNFTDEQIKLWEN